MRIKDAANTKEMRRSQLALTMLRRGVRTQNIRGWTGLTAARITKIRKAHTHEFPNMKLRRPTGRAPKTLCELVRRPHLRCEAAVLGGLCRIFSVLPREPVPDARRYLPSVVRGEQVCEIYDQFVTLVPSATMGIDELIGLLYSLADGEQHDIGWCTGCEAAILIDPYGSARRVCVHCVSAKNAPLHSRNRLTEAPP